MPPTDSDFDELNERVEGLEKRMRALEAKVTGAAFVGAMIAQGLMTLLERSGWL